MYSSSYNKLFGGMLFLIFDFNLGSINILPNFIGYILIYLALISLSSQHEIYKKGKVPTVILILLTIKDIYHDPGNNLLSGHFLNPRLTDMVIGSIASVIGLYLIYIICSGVYKLSEERALCELADKIKSSFMFYLVISLIVIFYIPFSINVPTDFNLFLIIAAIFQIIASLSIAFKFRNCRVTLEN